MTEEEIKANTEEYITNLLDKFGLEASILCVMKKSFVHSSSANEKDGVTALDSNERMEFLGDSLVGLVVSDMVFGKFSKVDEGTLTDYRARIVNGVVLADIARDLKLNDYLQLGRGEEAGGGRDNDRNLAGLFEAFIGAVFLTVGYDETVHMLKQIFKPFVDNVKDEVKSFDAKPALQELTQERFSMLPEYKVLNEEGPAHEKTFTVQVVIDGKDYGQGVGSSKKKAQQVAAIKTLEMLKK